VQATDAAMTALNHRRSRPVDEASICTVADRARVRRAIRLMEELADILL
jgi:hypothetical protein